MSFRPNAVSGGIPQKGNKLLTEGGFLRALRLVEMTSFGIKIVGYGLDRTVDYEQTYNIQLRFGQDRTIQFNKLYNTVGKTAFLKNKPVFPT